MNPFRRGKPETAPGPRLPQSQHRLMQAHVDMESRYLVATDYAVWGGFSDVGAASRHADAVARVIPIHERVVVTTQVGQAIYILTGESQTADTLRRVTA